MRNAAFLLTLGLLISVTVSASIPNVAADLLKLSRSSIWTPLSSIKLQFETFHPQGMVKVGDVYDLSSVEILEGTQSYPQLQNGLDRSAGKGRAHLFRFDGTGKLLADIILAEGEGDVYHVGGIDFDGKYVYVPVAEYRPNSAAILYRVDTATDRPSEVLRYRDHLGGVVVDTANHALHLVSWGAKRWYTWPLDVSGTPVTGAVKMHANSQSYIDCQDCHHLEGELALCSGVAYLGGHPTEASFGLGGLDLVKLNQGRVLVGFPVPCGNWRRRRPVPRRSAPWQPIRLPSGTTRVRRLSRSHCVTTRPRCTSTASNEIGEKVLGRFLEVGQNVYLRQVKPKEWRPHGRS